MKTSLTKEFKFEAAHRLGLGYQGKCSNVHGHSWVGRITVSKPDEQLDRFGMLVDFADIKRLIAEEVEALDHACLVCEGDQMHTTLVAYGSKCYVLPENPTSEVLARHLFKLFSKLFSDLGVTVDSVTIDETCTSSCTVCK